MSRPRISRQWSGSIKESGISNLESGIDYIVLSDQLISAAALTKYSFAKYYDTPKGQLFDYSLPTGGLL